MNWRIALGVAGLIALAILVGLFAVRYNDLEDAAICSSLYARARTAADTAQIDIAIAPKERGRQYRNTIQTCGDLRRSGVFVRR
jgi:hypothetical protein